MNKPSAEDISAFLAEALPSGDSKPQFIVEAVAPSSCRVRMVVRAHQLRPGASLSGPAQMALADVAGWTAILHNLGLGAAPSVTSNLNITFLSPPVHADLIADVQVLRLGKRSCVCEVRLRSAEQTALVAHATVSYAIAHSPA